MKPPYLRLPLAMLFVVPVFIGQGVAWGAARHLEGYTWPLLGTLLASVGGVATYRLYVRLFEHRAASELKGPGALRELGAGLLLGALLFSLTIAVLAASGAYRVHGTHGPAVLALPVLMAVASGTIEEIVFRGVVFRLVEEWLGTWVALLASAALFGLVHLGNPNATWQGALSIVLEAGVMLAAAYVLTRRLWLAIGIHAAWNFTQSGVYGVPTSGQAMPGLLDGALAGPAWLSGGEFGAEGSVVALLLCTLAGCVLLVRAHRLGRFVRGQAWTPPTTRRREPA